jgi:hypothetical protein
MRFWRKKPSQVLEVSVVDAVTMHESLGYKLIRTGQKRPLVEGFRGDDLHRNSGRWMRKIQIVDRENDRYFKQIVDPATGEILRQCEEPLSKHRGYGSAKRQAAIK